MKNAKYKIKNSKIGFTLIEALFFLFIFSLITLTFYNLYAKGIQHIADAKNRLTALALANEKMEVVRNLAFEHIAHTTGDPVGNLRQNEDVVRNGVNFNVFTQIKNHDDPYDGTLRGSPNDVNYIDYKFVKITVFWNDKKSNVSLSSRFVPAGIEQATAGKGVLVINVSSDKGGGAIVPQSAIRIQNSDTGFDETHSTDNYGRLMLIGISQSIKKYQITVSKNGYETVSTSPPYPITAHNPIHEHASVIADAVNSINIYQNRNSELTIRIKNYLGSGVGNIAFRLRGGKQIGTVYNFPHDPIYAVNNNYATNSGGEKNFNPISPGQYDFTLTDSSYKIIGSSQALPFSLSPGISVNLDVKVSPKNVTALLANITKSEDGGPLSGAAVRLVKSPDYDVSIVTGADGMAFFPNAENSPFASGTYDISVSVSGYQDYSGQVSVNSGEIKEENISMAAN